MRSLYDDLADRLEVEVRPGRRGGARVDLGLLLFDRREALRDLWVAADRVLRSPGPDALAGLERAVTRLYPLYGERPGP